MTTTPYNLISLALTDSGVLGSGQTPQAADMNNGLTRLNFMMSQWRRQRWLVYHLIDVAFVATGALSYTIGLGGDINVVRPDRLESGNFVRLLNSGQTERVDLPLALIQSREDYNRIVLKDMGTFPSQVFYDSAFPLGNVFVWPLPTGGDIYEIHLLMKEVLPVFTALNQSVNLPEEYEGAIYYNLQKRFRIAYRLPADEEINGLAKETLSVIRGANAQIATLRMPPILLGRQRMYNVFSDTP